MLPTRDDIGRAISPEEESILLAACGESGSRSLLPAVTLATNTCMRYSEIRLLQWRQVDFAARQITVGKSKTDFGTGRVIPLNGRAFAVLEFWVSNFPDRQPEHYVFPSERYGAAGNDFKACGIGKTVHLAVDWDHGESPLHGRLADSLVSEGGCIALRSKYTRGARKR